MTEAWWASDLRAPSLGRVIDYLRRRMRVVVSGIAPGYRRARRTCRVSPRPERPRRRAATPRWRLIEGLDHVQSLTFGAKPVGWLVGGARRVVLAGYDLLRRVPIPVVRDFAARRMLDSFLVDWFGDLPVLLDEPVQSANVRARVARSIQRPDRRRLRRHRDRRPLGWRPGDLRDAARSRPTRSSASTSSSRWARASVSRGGSRPTPTSRRSRPAIASWATSPGSDRACAGSTSGRRTTRLPPAHCRPAAASRRRRRGSATAAAAAARGDPAAPPGDRRTRRRGSGRGRSRADRRPSPLAHAGERRHVRQTMAGLANEAALDPPAPTIVVESRPVTNEMNVLTDHGAYWANPEGFLVPLVRHLDAARGDASASRFYRDDADRTRRILWRRQRVAALAAWGWLCSLGAIVTAAILIVLQAVGDRAHPRRRRLAAVWGALPGHELVTVPIEAAASIGGALLSTIGARRHRRSPGEPRAPAAGPRPARRPVLRPGQGRPRALARLGSARAAGDASGDPGPSGSVAGRRPGVPVGRGLVGLVLASSAPAARPLVIVLGAAAGLLIWLGRSFRPRPAPPSRPSPQTATGSRYSPKTPRRTPHCSPSVA